MPEITVGPEAGLFRNLAKGLLRAPARVGEDATEQDLLALVRAGPGKRGGGRFFRRADPNAEFRQALARGDDPYSIMRRTLNSSGRHGSEALMTMDRYGIKVEYRLGGGSNYIHSANTIHVDLNNGDAVGQLVHEVTHARWAHEGRGGYQSIATSGKADFVSSCIREEVDAGTHEIYVNMYRRSMNPNLRLPDRPLQSNFENGYAAGVQRAEAAARSQGRSLTPDERVDAGDEAGRQAMYDEYASGRVVGSVTRLSYKDKLAMSWEVHRLRA